MASFRKEGICPHGRIKIYSSGSYENILGVFYVKVSPLFFFLMKDALSFQIYEDRKDLKSGRYMNDKERMWPPSDNFCY